LAAKDSLHLSFNPSISGRAIATVHPVWGKPDAFSFNPSISGRAIATDDAMLASDVQIILSTHPFLEGRLRLPALESFSCKLFKLLFGKLI
jgi:hypothetical protein